MFRPILAGAAVALAALTVGTAAASASTFHFFRTPSNQIGCVYQTGPAYLRCDVMYRTRFTSIHRFVRGMREGDLPSRAW